MGGQEGVWECQGGVSGHTPLPRGPTGSCLKRTVNKMKVNVSCIDLHLLNMFTALSRVVNIYVLRVTAPRAVDLHFGSTFVLILTYCGVTELLHFLELVRFVVFIQKCVSYMYHHVFCLLSFTYSQIQIPI